ncbi:glycoside hydrolase family 3 N-terminal domain-containing protein [Shimia sp. Alg240-R146]|uniref:glycoside hydrolase family 3 N-terminal domain-containing protein n=1 Tax=Shimia sp. Alg240-R146 TaxID=2993449 RepID=UPI0022E9606C|nr:glycoside hydrolase family 3 protein [Shimia sp. Alg240-R146]
MDRFGATIFGCEGLQLSGEERAFFRDVRPFGFILFGRNIESADQVRALCEDLRACVPHHAPILIDQEGGRVQRFRAPLASEFLPPLEQVVAAGENAERAMYLRYRIIAHELLSLGLDANCAPMVDVAHKGTHPFLKNRCYGYDSDSVSRIGRAVADGLSDGGVLPVVKHMPGHGRAVVDSHFDLPTVAAPVEELDADFAPFKALSDLPMGMTAHLVYEAIDAAPATTSAKMMQLIRDVIGFGGLIMTDDINMKALKGSLGALSRASIDAGCDVVLHCNGDFAEMQEVAQATGEMTDAAQIRAEAALAARKSPDTVDIEALSAELKAF